VPVLAFHVRVGVVAIALDPSAGDGFDGTVGSAAMVVNDAVNEELDPAEFVATTFHEYLVPLARAAGE